MKYIDEAQLNGLTGDIGERLRSCLLYTSIGSGFGGKGLCRHVRRPVQAAQRAVQEIRGGRESRKAVTIDRYM